MVHQIGPLLGGALRIPVGARNGQFGRLFAELLEPEVPVCEEAPGIARYGRRPIGIGRRRCAPRYRRVELSQLVGYEGGFAEA